MRRQWQRNHAGHFMLCLHAMAMAIHGNDNAISSHFLWPLLVVEENYAAPGATTNLYRTWQGGGDAQCPDPEPLLLQTTTSVRA
jgi:hypothetical protein